LGLLGYDVHTKDSEIVECKPFNTSKRCVQDARVACRFLIANAVQS
jgi:hypothetical protein